MFYFPYMFVGLVDLYVLLSLHVPGDIGDL